MTYKRLSFIIMILSIIALAAAVLLAPTANAPIRRPVSPLLFLSPINVTVTPVMYLPLVNCDDCPTVTPTPTVTPPPRPTP